MKVLNIFKICLSKNIALHIKKYMHIHLKKWSFSLQLLKLHYFQWMNKWQAISLNKTTVRETFLMKPGW